MTARASDLSHRSLIHPLPSSFPHLRSINEPDLSSQSNVEPATAAQLWMTYMQPFAGQATLVGPAITNGGAPMGTTWLDSFMDECNKLGCQVDAIAGHIYGSASDADYYKTYITSLGSRYPGKPLLMTEIGVSDASTAIAESRVTSAGFHTTVSPQTRARAVFQA